MTTIKLGNGEFKNEGKEVITLKELKTLAKLFPSMTVLEFLEVQKKYK